MSAAGIDNYGITTLEKCTVSKQHALSADGAGIFNRRPLGTLTIEGSATSDNTANDLGRAASPMPAER